MESKIAIPADFRAPGVKIVGIIHQAGSAPSKKLALIIHGVLAHKDQSYHKLLARRLGQERGLDSFRYDLVGQGGESEGPWDMAAFDDDSEDLVHVIAYLKEHYGYEVELMVSHSRGSMFSCHFLACHKHDPIPYFVNVSGRYDMTRILQNPKYVQAFEVEKKEKTLWKVKVAGKVVERWVTPREWYGFASWDNSYVISTFPQDTHVLNIHGLADALVPYEDACTFHSIFSQRSPGTSELKLVPDMGHNWAKPGHEPVNSIMDWFSRVNPVDKKVETSPARL